MKVGTNQQTAEVRKSSRRIVRELNMLQGAHADLGLSNSESHTLVVLEESNQLSSRQLSEILLLEKSTVSRLVEGLKKRRLISIGISPLDKRQQIIELSDQGRAMLKQVHEQANGRVLSALNCCSAEERSAIVRGLTLYAEALETVRTKDRKPQ